ncbi:hypothetical protein HRR80_006100 [Exophiala dermatitidis]|uniref:Uncharacterized protein n=1 Tax=Exophiala dermatitidis TaxID=5970 RepID=A0AAN6ESK3_EXODE|nr:hypothetical protein HRR79_007219 [Exophiala dermatitidis]KAJ4570112.1 hypothetical protein HRR82_007676 [Exophiala dermatitidis]KAJ4606671.1 hypothetical protein HRR85_007434 [Exophiala dermatitidis]KAJ4632968.1 hypothetical protein HRR86_002099 [Exophiala dermatitidis]KAJ8989964.1 hypothetical protein HRR80_006100 [Exophiala dermatitidis]
MSGSAKCMIRRFLKSAEALQRGRKVSPLRRPALCPAANQRLSLELTVMADRGTLDKECPSIRSLGCEPVYHTHLRRRLPDALCRYWINLTSRPCRDELCLWNPATYH